jgi:hypothetical protein
MDRARDLCGILATWLISCKLARAASKLIPTIIILKMTGYHYFLYYIYLCKCKKYLTQNNWSKCHEKIKNINHCSISINRFN